MKFVINSISWLFLIAISGILVDKDGPSSAEFLLGNHKQQALICTQNTFFSMIRFKVLLIIPVADKFVFSGPGEIVEVWIKPRVGFLYYLITKIWFVI